jgi:hypothetical protein
VAVSRRPNPSGAKQPLRPCVFTEQEYGLRMKPLVQMAPSSAGDGRAKSGKRLGCVGAFPVHDNWSATVHIARRSSKGTLAL